MPIGRRTSEARKQALYGGATPTAKILSREEQERRDAAKLAEEEEHLLAERVGKAAQREAQAAAIRSSGRRTSKDGLLAGNEPQDFSPVVGEGEGVGEGVDGDEGSSRDASLGSERTPHEGQVEERKGDGRGGGAVEARETPSAAALGGEQFPAEDPPNRPPSGERRADVQGTSVADMYERVRVALRGGPR